MHFSEELMHKLTALNLHEMGGLHALEHALIGLYPLVSICDRSDLAGISTKAHAQTGGASVFIYDGYHGGLGLAESALDQFTELLKTTLDHVSSCECDTGCPYCIHSPKCGSGNEPLDKSATIHILQNVCGVKEFTMKRKKRDVKQVNDYVLPQLPEKDECPKDTDIVFDIETRHSADDVGGWKNSHNLDRYEYYGEEHVEQLMDRIMNAKTVIGFNSEGFDFKVLSGYSPVDIENIGSLDLLSSVRKQLGHRLSLDMLTSATLNAEKTADGLQSLEWWKQGRLDLIAEYCKKDVELTCKLYQYGQEHGYVLYFHRGIKVRIPVGWGDR